jgi:hypothetical protein
MKLRFRARFTPLRILAIPITTVVAFPALATPGLAQTGPQPTATDVFHLRSECAALGEELGDRIEPEYRAEYHVSSYDELSHYEPRTNRCYVQLQFGFTDKKAPVDYYYKNTCLYDAQTGESLACARLRADKRSVVQPDQNSSDISTLDRFQVSYGEALAFINERMADDRTQ